ncbi:hypothetical protein [Sorangium sp. So ce1335]|uniref:hypothetical protein n=1 Tax=Sorangium sp. So ce1335 TaxID=3133335 RepID=UPI003F61672B
MSLVEMLQYIQSLPRADKLKLIQFLAQELAEAEGPPSLQAGQSYPVWSPDQAFAAAETLLQTLHTE